MLMLELDMEDTALEALAMALEAMVMDMVTDMDTVMAMDIVMGQAMGAMDTNMAMVTHMVMVKDRQTKLLQKIGLLIQKQQLKQSQKLMLVQVLDSVDQGVMDTVLDTEALDMVLDMVMVDMDLVALGMVAMDWEDMDSGKDLQSLILK